MRPTVSAYAANAGTTTVTLTISEAGSGSPDATDFTGGHECGGAENTVTAVTIAEDGESIALTLTDIIQNNASLTVTYAKSSTTK